MKEVNLSWLKVGLYPLKSIEIDFIDAVVPCEKTWAFSIGGVSVIGSFQGLVVLTACHNEHGRLYE